jgi:hypothetical protein
LVLSDTNEVLLTPKQARHLKAAGSNPIQDLNLRRFGPYDRKSRRAQLYIRNGDRNYDRSIAGLGTGKAQRYFASDFDRLSSRWFDANGDRCGES